MIRLTSYRRMTKGDSSRKNVERERKPRRLQKRPSAKNWPLRERHLLRSLRNLRKKCV